MSAVPFESRLAAVEREALTNTVKLSEHEKQCAERYDGIRSDIRSIRGTMLWVGCGLIAGMAGILVKLVFFPSGS